MKYGYARVSTKGQARDGNSLEAQIADLTAAGCEKIVKEAYTGKIAERPKLDELRALLRNGDTLVVTKLDRLARSASEGSRLIRELLDQGVSVHVLNMGLIDGTPTGKLISTVLFAFAEFERDMIVERTQEGKAIARQNPNYREGRPKKYSPDQLNHAMELLESHPYSMVERMTGISKSTLQREKRRRNASQ